MTVSYFHTLKIPSVLNRSCTTEALEIKASTSSAFPRRLIYHLTTMSCSVRVTKGYTLCVVSHTLHLVSYTLHVVIHTLHVVSHTLRVVSDTLHVVSHTLHVVSHTLHVVSLYTACG